MFILGISGTFSPGSAQPAAVLVSDGKVVAACEEERICRVKDVLGILPDKAIAWVLSEAGIGIEDIDVIACPVATYDGFEAMLRRHLKLVHGAAPKRLVMVPHHLAHAASVYYGSGWDESAILTYDYSGDGVCAGLYHGKGSTLATLEEVPTSEGNSLGKLYAALTQFLGFGRNDEYKVMGGAAYWDRADLYDMGSIIEIGSDWFKVSPEIYTDSQLLSPFQLLFEEDYLQKHFFAARKPSDPIADEHKRFAASLQDAFERAAMTYVHRLKQATGASRLCMAGGCALNGVFNGKVLESGLFEEVYISPASGDAGGALGAAYYCCVQNGVHPDAMDSALLGPEYSPDAVRSWLDTLQVSYSEPQDICEAAAQDIAEGKLVGWFQGRMEYGPRALGARSILADPGRPEMRDCINQRVKFREDFRPFAPSVLLESTQEFFDLKGDSPFMSFVCPSKFPDVLPAVTHVDDTARVQTVADVPGNEMYRSLITEVGKRTGRNVVLNTSFNYNGQPIVNTPQEAVYTFNGTGLDVLYVGPFKVAKK